jgi:hypothetical protein
MFIAVFLRKIRVVGGSAAQADFSNRATVPHSFECVGKITKNFY